MEPSLLSNQNYLRRIESRHQLTKPSDVQTIFDSIPVKDKRLFWIEGTTRRFEGYNYFPEHPEQMLEWFETHMGKTTAKAA